MSRTHDHPHDSFSHAHDDGDGSPRATHGPSVHSHAHESAAHIHAHGHAHDHWHDEDEFHDHHGEDLSPEEQQELAERLWRLENVELRTVGVDIGSSTSHLMFAEVHLRRLSDALSSRFVVVRREVLWRSAIEITPYRADDTIDTDALEAFIERAYRDAGIRRDAIDSGAVILTGEALKRKNAEAIAHLFAAESGKFVCALAGHHMEASLAAHGSGAVAISRRNRSTVLNVDIGGGTSKFALIRDGEIVSTAAIAIGGRLVALDDAGRVTRLEEPGRFAAEAAGLQIALGEPVSPDARMRLVRYWVDALVRIVNGEEIADETARLFVTDPIVLREPIDSISFSGGVSEYVYGRERAAYQDLGAALGHELAAALGVGRIPHRLADPGEGIRATVIGASQFTVQLSGSTISVSNRSVLPLRNLPVVYPRIDLSQEITPEHVSRAIDAALRRMDVADAAVALGLRWPGDPLYRRLRVLAQGIAGAMAPFLEQRLPLVLLFDRDVGRTLGEILRRDLDVACDVISIDGMDLKEFDFVDIGEVVEASNVVPVVIKSLLFAGRESIPSR
ncbi:MAG TPA: ethanolamine ammonia-lyase reactivating factor EutA [Chloroflexota bacterium]|nr:ethanolamine ammonia-lyase reactivating factor EutA [Chloroflexota bacterium]